MTKGSTVLIRQTINTKDYRYLRHKSKERRKSNVSRSAHKEDEKDRCLVNEVVHDCSKDGSYVARMSSKISDHNLSFELAGTRNVHTYNVYRR